ncbi:MAG TPA: hypothetical protein DCZ91_04860 [Lachnospiraceae bacterium]|nr:hypothetical protein [Lachnospiraceae bacterium]
MDGLGLNVMLVIAVLAVAVKMADGYKKGMVREVISLISMVVLCVVAALIAYGVNGYHDGKVFHVVLAVILFILVMTVHHLLGLVFFSAKLFSKLPIVHTLDKLLGIVFGIFEVVLLLWTVYAFIMMMDMGAIGQAILACTEESALLTWVYQHNYLAHWIGAFLDEFDFVPLIELLGL